jgi:hypothetical protein
VKVQATTCLYRAQPGWPQSERKCTSTASSSSSSSSSSFASCPSLVHRAPAMSLPTNTMGTGVHNSEQPSGGNTPSTAQTNENSPSNSHETVSNTLTSSTSTTSSSFDVTSIRGTPEALRATHPHCIPLFARQIHQYRTASRSYPTTTTATTSCSSSSNAQQQRLSTWCYVQSPFLRELVTVSPPRNSSILAVCRVINLSMSVLPHCVYAPYHGRTNWWTCCVSIKTSIEFARRINSRLFGLPELLYRLQELADALSLQAVCCSISTIIV